MFWVGARAEVIKLFSAPAPENFLFSVFITSPNNGIFRDGTRLFSGIPESRKSPGILEKGKKFWNLEKLKESYNSNF